MNQMKNAEIQRKITELEDYWKPKCKEYEYMEISPHNAAKFHAAFATQARPIEWELKNQTYAWDILKQIDQIRNDLDIAITKGQTIYRNNESRRFNEKYGILGPILTTLVLFLKEIISVIFHK